MRRLTEQQVRACLEKEGYRLLSPYIKAAVKIKTICPLGHLHECVFTSFQQGHRCGTCSGHNRWNLEKIREELKREEYTLFANEYKGIHHRLAVQCPLGHLCTISWASFQSGHKCKACGVEKRTRGRRVDISEIRRVVEKEGYQLLSTEYGGPNQKLEAICPKGHKYYFQWYRFTKGTRCGKCYRWNFEKVKRFIEADGFRLLSKEYRGSHKYLKIQCPEGHKYRVLWTNFQQGYRCPDCMHNNKRLTIEEIRSSFEKEGYNLISSKYTNINSVLEYECNKGHRNSVKWHIFKQGHRCPDCAGKIEPMKRIEMIRDLLEKEGYRLLSNIYINNSSPLEYECSQGHKSKVCWGSIQQGYRCFACSGNQKYSLEEIEKEFLKEGYILLSKEYRGANTKLFYKCSKEHQGQITWTNFQQGHRCPDCGEWKNQRLLGEILDKIYSGRVERQSSLGFLGRQRADYVLPDIRVVVEYDGEQHFKPVVNRFGIKTLKEARKRLKETRQRDRKKDQLCQENGWKMVRVKYNEKLTPEHIKRKIEE